MQALLNVAIDTARKAGDYIVRAGDRMDLVAVTAKDKNDFVTEVDQKAEQMIISMIRDHFPDHGILAEESGSQAGNDEFVWIIDPLDGTKNFIHGLPHYCVSIAVKRNNQTEIGVIYNPCTQEFFSASRGRGAKLNDKRIRVTEQKQMPGALLGTGFPFKYKDQFPFYRDMFSALFEQVTDIRRAGSAALDLAYVAAGRLDGYWEIGLQPWDMAAGNLMVREAGGLISDFLGGEAYLESGNIIAANPRLFKLMLQTLQPITKQYAD